MALSAGLMFRPVTELAAMVRVGELSASELVESSLRSIDARNPAINAFVDVDAEGARAAAAAIHPGDTRPFAGVPIAVKNNRAVKGLRLTHGSRVMGDFRPDHDDPLVARLREAGFVVVGTTSMSEWGILPTTEPRRFGATRNPWDLTRSPGGSSGGSAAAVAAGMVPVAHGNDGGGSIRIPAACCGLVGLKPQRGRVLGGTAEHVSLLAQDGVLTRCVHDTAVLLDVLAAPSPYRPLAFGQFARATTQPAGRMRIGLATQPWLVPARVQQASIDAAHDTARLLAQLGHDVEELPAEWGDGLTPPLAMFTAVFAPLICADIAASVGSAKRRMRGGHLEPLTRWLWNTHRSITGAAAEVAVNDLVECARHVLDRVDPYDALLTPALAQPPPLIGELDPCGPDPLATFERSGHFTPYTAISNVTGSPAISLPLYTYDDGLPLAVQLIGRPAQEGALLALAAQIEAAAPWAGRHAPLAEAGT